MSGLKLIGASAGSGKTYTITGECLKMLFEDTSNYKNILAVTFTNKATDEMKFRILEELHLLAIKSKDSGYKSMLIREFNLDPDTLALKAQEIQAYILHDYSRFSVSTIDSFFMRVLKSFAKELGLQTNFTTELDHKAVLNEVAELLISELENDSQLQKWLQDFAFERLLEGKKWDFKNDLIDLGNQIFKEEFKDFDSSSMLKIADKKSIKEYKESLEVVKVNFENHLHHQAKQAFEMMQNNDLVFTDFLYGKSGVGNFFNKILDNDFDVKTRVYEAINDGKWTKSDSPKKKAIETLVSSGFDLHTRKMVEYIENHFRHYNSACIILENIYTIGILADLTKSLISYSAENNIFLLANTGELIRKLLEGNDTPFIYEKVGNLYKHFIIDEFQDTSKVQWENFKPLISNSLSEGNFDLLVGDIKQSIYRWRNGDWKIMARGIENDFSNFNIDRKELETNWRSRENVILFNNSIFAKAPSLLQNQYNQTAGIEDSEGLITLAYRNQMQLFPNKENKKGGLVKISFFDSKENKDWEELSKNKLIEYIDELRLKGYSYKQMAVLVRDNKEAKEIATFFLNYNNLHNKKYRIEFISNESMHIYAAPAVKILVSALQLIVNKHNAIVRELLLSEYRLFNANKELQQRIVEDELSILPVEYADNIDNLYSVPLLELVGRLIAIFKLNNDKLSLPYLQAFVDAVALYLNNHYSDISKFLDWWKEQAPKYNICASDQQDAIRILTIHKSKGLQFENVFLPFCDWAIDHNSRLSNMIWVRPTEEPFNKAAHIPVKYGSNLMQSIFENDYLIEKENAYIDNLNLLYVATTRVVDNLFIGATYKKDEKTILNVGALLHQIILTSNIQEQSNYIELKNYYSKDECIFSYGSIENNNAIEKKDFIDLKHETLNYKQVLGNVRQRFQSADFFSNINDSKKEKIDRGVMMHRIFQNILIKTDVNEVLDKHLFKGEITSIEKNELLLQIEEVMTQEPYSDWYGGQWEIKSETDIIVPQKGTYRPDRVMILGSKAIVVDYKFGQKENTKYQKQVGRYMQFLKEMDYRSVEGYIWYFDQMRLEKIN